MNLCNQVLTRSALGTFVLHTFSFDTVPEIFQREIDSVFRVILGLYVYLYPDSDIFKDKCCDSTVVVDTMF